MNTNLTSTAPNSVASSRQLRHELMELLGSMRFAISLLSLIAVASVIGTVLKQNEPMPNYINQFGPFWFELFKDLNLYSVYTSWWFLTILLFLVCSTSLCLIRNSPKMLKDMRSWRENVREQSLQNFAHKASWTSPENRTDVTTKLHHKLMQRGYKIKTIKKTDATLIAAKKGAANKLGYIFAHSAIIIILLGGTLDSDLAIKFQQWFMGKSPFEGNGIISQISEQHRLTPGTPTFRGNTMVPEGQSSSTTIIQEADGVFIQDLPFTIHLKKFIVDFYSTGMPKLFSSEVDIQDHTTGKTFSATIKVNEPLIYAGVAVYQSSFEDGGSKLKLAAWPMRDQKSSNSTDIKPYEISGEVNSSTALAGVEPVTIEWSGFRAFNVENMQASATSDSTSDPESGQQDVRSVKKAAVSLGQQLAKDLDLHSGSSAKGSNTKDLRNVGASVQYKLRDKTGQAQEFNNYMQPVVIDGDSVFLAGMRDSPSEPFRYLRIPADDNNSVQEWMRLKAALASPELRSKAAAEYAMTALPDDSEGHKLRSQLRESAQRSLDIFAGDTKAAGFVAVSQFLNKIPEQEQERASEIFMKIFNGSLWNLWQVARNEDGLPALKADTRHAHFLQLASNALSDAFFYNAPVYLQLTSYEEIKASVFQVSRSPGKKIVYLGCLLLVLGIFSMFYIRERRVWVWIKDQNAPESSQQTRATFAISTQRKTLDFETEFTQLKLDLTETGSTEST